MNQDIEKIKGLAIKPNVYQVLFADGGTLNIGKSTVETLKNVITLAGYKLSFGRWVDGNYFRVIKPKPVEKRVRVTAVSLDGAIMAEISRRNCGGRRGILTQRFGKYI